MTGFCHLFGEAEIRSKFLRRHIYPKVITLTKMVMVKKWLLEKIRGPYWQLNEYSEVLINDKIMYQTLWALGSIKKASGTIIQSEFSFQNCTRYMKSGNWLVAIGNKVTFSLLRWFWYMRPRVCWWNSDVTGKLVRGGLGKASAAPWPRHDCTVESYT